MNKTTHAIALVLTVVVFRGCDQASPRLVMMSKCPVLQAVMEKDNATNNYWEAFLLKIQDGKQMKVLRLCPGRNDYKEETTGEDSCLDELQIIFDTEKGADNYVDIKKKDGNHYRVFLHLHSHADIGIVGSLQ